MDTLQVKSGSASPQPRSSDVWASGDAPAAQESAAVTADEHEHAWHQAPDQRSFRIPDPFISVEAYEHCLDRTVFFARVAFDASEDNIAALFSRWGHVEEVMMFRRNPVGKATIGSGLVVMSTHEEASSAIDGLHEQLTWPGLRNPMVCHWHRPGQKGVRARARQEQAVFLAARAIQAKWAATAAIESLPQSAAGAAAAAAAAAAAGFGLQYAPLGAAGAAGAAASAAAAVAASAQALPAYLEQRRRRQLWERQQQENLAQAAAVFAAHHQQQQQQRQQQSAQPAFLGAGGLLGGGAALAGAWPSVCSLGSGDGYSESPLTPVLGDALYGGGLSFGGASMYRAAAAGGQYDAEASLATALPQSQAFGGLPQLGIAAAPAAQLAAASQLIALPPGLAGFDADAAPAVPAGAAKPAVSAVGATAPGLLGGSGGKPGVCSCQLQLTGEGLQRVVQHAAALMEMSGATLSLHPGAAGAGSVAVTGTLVQVQEASRLLSLVTA